MNALHLLNLGLRFGLELCLLAALAYWGFQLEQGWLLRLVATAGGPLLVALVWGTFVAPKASRPLQDPWRFALEIVLFGLGAVALVAAQRPAWGVALLLIFLANRLLLMLTTPKGQSVGTGGQL